MANRLCSKCEFYQISYLASDHEGLCRRFPPQIRQDGEFRFPVTHVADWCGEFSPTPAQE